MARREIIIKDTHRGLWYQDGVLRRVLEAGRYTIPWRPPLPFPRRPRIEVVLVDVRERDLTIKGQEILTADKVALRVSIVVQFRVTDPKAALHNVESYEERLYTDVQLAARRSPRWRWGTSSPTATASVTTSSRTCRAQRETTGWLSAARM